jgi:hypothetical protein
LPPSPRTETAGALGGRLFKIEITVARALYHLINNKISLDITVKKIYTSCMKYGY